MAEDKKIVDVIKLQIDDAKQGTLFFNTAQPLSRLSGSGSQ
jgi:hypothetical protein